MYNKSVYSSFNSIPWKLVKANNIIKDGRVVPLHIRLYPTNKCNGNCSWCCYSDIDRTISLNKFEIMEIIDYFKFLGTQAITFSGGGEPTVHEDIELILHYAYSNGIKCGLVTNGLLWGRKNVNLEKVSKVLTWARVSIIDTVGDYNTDIIKNFVNNLKDVDIGISFVVTRDVNIELAKKLCKFVEENKSITHIKFIQDSFDIENFDAMNSIIQICTPITNKAFYVWRNNYESGKRNCYISLLKPVIAASGMVYPCCDTQNAMAENVRTMEKEFEMGHWSEFENLNWFNGENCVRCYYGNYNKFLGNIINTNSHDIFL